MASASCGRSALNSCTKSSKRACCCRLFMPGGRVASRLRVRCMRSWRPFCWGLAGLDAFDGDAQSQPPDGKLRQIEERVWAGEGHAVVGADGQRQAALCKEPLKGGDGEVVAGRLKGFAKEQESRGMVGDGQRIAVASVAKLELPLEVGAPQVVRRRTLGQRRSTRAL